jgi:hypothetical protein
MIKRILVVLSFSILYASFCSRTIADLTPAVNSNNPDWHVVAEFTGQCTKNTAIFRVGPRWRLNWKSHTIGGVAANFIAELYSMPDNQDDNNIANAVGTSGSSTEEYQAGDFYISINSSENYDITILEPSTSDKSDGIVAADSPQEPWVTVASFNGDASGERNTPSFTVGNHWRMEFNTSANDASGNFWVTVKDPNSADESDTVGDVSGTCSDVSDLYHPGTFYLDIVSTQPYSVTVQDLGSANKAANANVQSDPASSLIAPTPSAGQGVAVTDINVVTGTTSVSSYLASWHSLNDTNISTEASFDVSALNPHFKMTVDQIDTALQQAKQDVDKNLQIDDLDKPSYRMPSGIRGSHGRSHESGVWCLDLDGVPFLKVGYDASKLYRNPEIPVDWLKSGAYTRTVTFSALLMDLPKIGVTLFDADRLANEDAVNVEKFFLTDDSGQSIDPVAGSIAASGVETGSDTFYSSGDPNRSAYLPFYTETYTISFPLFDASTGKCLVPVGCKKISLHIVTGTGESQVDYLLK